jgi:hypothetical protein
MSLDKYLGNHKIVIGNAAAFDDTTINSNSLIARAQGDLVLAPEQNILITGEEIDIEVQNTGRIKSADILTITSDSGIEIDTPGYILLSSSNFISIVPDVSEDIYSGSVLTALDDTGAVGWTRTLDIDSLDIGPATVGAYLKSTDSSGTLAWGSWTNVDPPTDISIQPSGGTGGGAVTISSGAANSSLTVGNNYSLLSSGTSSVTLSNTQAQISVSNNYLTASVSDQLFQVIGNDSSNYSQVSTMLNQSTGANADVLLLMVGAATADENNAFIRFAEGVSSTSPKDSVSGNWIGKICGDGAGGIQTLGYSFTGAHASVMPKEEALSVGLIVSSSGEIWSSRIMISSALPKTCLSKGYNDKNVFGVLSAIAPDEYQGFARANGVDESEILIRVNSIGEGRVWVSNINGEIELGDYITSSPIPGFGSRQGDDILRSCTVAKCTETINWNDVSEEVSFDGALYKKYLAACTYHCG